MPEDQLLEIEDTPALAVQGGRCIDEPRGCGKSITVNRRTMEYWPDDSYRREWWASGRCVECQDKVRTK